MNRQDQLEELLVDWSLQRQQGNDLTVEELCKDCPELAPDLAALISDIKATDWRDDDDDSDDDFLRLPDFSTVSGHADATRLPGCEVSLDEFVQRLIDSELMDREQVRQLRQRIPVEDARSFARQLVAVKKLTRFQASVLLEGRDIPLVLDRYVLLGEIGKGGMGAVYKALHQRMDRVVALKILPKEAVDSPEKVKRFHREVKAAAKLEHQNIVTAHDAREDKGYHFLVMSLVNGSDLADLVRKQGLLSCAKAVDYIAQAARGLAHAHGMGIVHRDIKPGNLLLNKEGVLKVLDMGLARIDGGDPEDDKTLSMELTQSGMVMGTIAYLAPEQALDTRKADARSDIYSLGCTLFYLLTGKAPYNEDTMMKTIMAHREGAIPFLCDQRKGVPAELDTIFQKMIAKKPEDRFQNMTELLSALETLDIKDEEGIQPVVAGSQQFQDTVTLLDTSREPLEPATANSGKPPKRRMGLIASGLLGFVVLLAGLTIRLQTPAGTIVLEIDQPDLIGAVVTIDGEKKITIQTGKGKEPIEITPDDKRHLLEVKIAGYKTFSKEFSFETGNKQTIKVRLEPLDGVVDGKEPKENPVVAASSAEKWALEFDGEGDYVEIPSLKIDASGPLVFEAWCNITPGKNLAEDNLDPLFVTNTLTQQSLGNVLIYARDNDGYWMASQTLSGKTAVSTQLYMNNGIQEGQVHHVASLWNGSDHGLYYDGVLVDRGGKTGPPISTDSEDRDLPPLIGRVRLIHTMSLRYLQGMISAVRISNVARYSKDFTPEKRLENDEHTLALYHFDEGQGDVLTDSSGNGHHGTIIGAKWVRVDGELKVMDEGQPSEKSAAHTSPQGQ